MPKIMEICLRSLREDFVEVGASPAFGSKKNSVGEIMLIRETISEGKIGSAASSESRLIKLHISEGMLMSASVLWVGSTYSSVNIVMCWEIVGSVICDEDSLVSDVPSSESEACPGGPKNIAGLV